MDNNNICWQMSWSNYLKFTITIGYGPAGRIQTVNPESFILLLVFNYYYSPLDYNHCFS